MLNLEQNEISSMSKESGERMNLQKIQNSTISEKQSKEEKSLTEDLKDENDRDENHRFKEELFEAQNTINKLKKDAAHEIVSNVIEINRLKAELEEEKKRNSNFALENDIVLSPNAVHEI